MEGRYCLSKENEVGTHHYIQVWSVYGAVKMLIGFI